MKRFTNIDHIARFYMDLTLTEYCIADSIFNLKNREHSEVKGWCTVPQEKLGNFIGISRVSVNKIVKKLEEKSLIEKTKSGLLKTTYLWDEAHELTEEEKLQAVNKVNTNSKQSLQQGVNKVNTHLYKQTNNKEYTSEEPQIELEIYPTFKDFWDSGLPKTDEDRAQRYWKKISQTDREKIMVHVPDYVEASGGKQFSRGAATYLHNKTWKNEIINRKNAEGIVASGITKSGTESRVREYMDEG